MGKSSKKNASKQQKVKVKEITPELIESQASDVGNMENTILEASDDAIPEEAELSDSEKKAVDEIMSSKDAEKYLNRLLGIHKMLLATKKNYEDLREKVKLDAEKAEEDISKRKDSVKEEEKRIEQDRSTLELEKKEIVKQKQDIQRREVAMSDKLYTDVILNLLESFKETEENVTKATAERIKDLSDQQQELLKKHLEQLGIEEDLIERKAVLEADKLSLEKEKEQFEKHKNRESNRLSLKESEIREDVEEEFEEKIEELEKENKQLSIDNSRLKKENDKYSSTINELWSLAGDLSPEEILIKLRTSEEEVIRLKNELDNRPTTEDYQQKKDSVDILTSKVEELQEQVNEEELAKLREKLSNENYYIQEINQFHSRIDTLNANLEHKDSLIEQLQGVIAQLRGEDGKKKKAFEFAKLIDECEDYKEPLKNKSQMNGYNLKQMVQYLQSYMYTFEEYSYDTKTIRLFIAGLNMSPLTILQGISGTGKTSLPREIAKAMVADSDTYQGFSLGMPNAPYSICAIQSGWRDRMDLIGYFNHFDKKYQETDFFRALYMASLPKYRNTMFFIILDEMNLSHPEHYFADFLSLLEQDEKDRFINIDAPSEFMPAMITSNGKMKIPANVRFIGTANQDPTTVDFAPKTCDRSNIMDIKRARNTEIKKSKEKMVFTYEWLEKQFENAKDKYSQDVVKFVEFLSKPEVEDMFSKVGIGIGKRLEEQAKRFISVYIATEPEEREKSLAEAADHLIATRLLRGIENRLELKAPTLKELKDELDYYFNESFGNEPKDSLAKITNAINK